jgi:subtilisin family serine protease
MNEEDRRKIFNDEYTDVIFDYAINPEEISRLAGETINYINDKYAVLYIPVTSVQSRLLLLGFIDTGIDYQNPLFKYADNTTRIISIWDQTIENLSATSDIFYFGTEYTREQINLALQSENPLDIVPSTDEIGHGTTLAGLAGGTPDLNADFYGVAPLTEYIIVKLKTAKPGIKDFFGVPDNVLCYAESDIMFGLTYLVNTARKLNRPIAICIGLGTNQGGHTGVGPLNDVISLYANQVGIGIIIAAGNEGNAAHHFYGEIDPAIGYSQVELRVGSNENNFSGKRSRHLFHRYCISFR